MLFKQVRPVAQTSLAATGAGRNTFDQCCPIRCYRSNACWSNRLYKCCSNTFDQYCCNVWAVLFQCLSSIVPMFEHCSSSLGDHKPGEVDSRLLFKLDYCLPDCVLKSSRGQHDEQQQLNKVSQVTDRDVNSPYWLQYVSLNVSAENLVLHIKYLLVDDFLDSHIKPVCLMMYW